MRLDSLKSDGIPVGTELSGDGDQYIWSSDNEEIEDSGSPEKVPDLTSQYPTEELPERFFEVSKNSADLMLLFLITISSIDQINEIHNEKRQ